MSKKLTLLGFGAVLAAGAGTTMATLYGIEAHKFEEKFLNTYMTKLANQINALPAPEGVAYKMDVEKLQKQLEDKIKEFDEAHLSHKEALRDVIQEDIQQRLEDAKTLIRSEMEHKDEGIKTLINNSVAEVTNILSQKVDEYEQGIIGSHDLNYYSTVLEDALNTTHLETLELALQANGAGIKSVNEKAENYKKILDEFQALFNNFKTDTNNKQELQDKTLSDFIANMESSLLTLENKISSSQGTTLDEVKIYVNNELAPVANSLNELKENFFTLKNDFKDFVDFQTNVVTMDIYQIREFIAKLSDDLTGFISQFTDLEKVVNELSSTQTKHKNEIQYIQQEQKRMNNKITQLVSDFSNLINQQKNNTTKITNLETASEELKHQNNLLNKRIDELERLTANYNSLVKSLDTLTANDQNQNTEIKKIQDELNKTILKTDNHELRISITEGLVSSLTNSISEFKKQISVISDLVSNNKTEIEKYAKEIRGLSDQIANILNTLDTLALDIQKNKSDLTNLATEVYASKDRITALESKQSQLVYQNANRNKGLNPLSWFTLPKPLTNKTSLELKMYWSSDYYLTIPAAINSKAYKNSVEFIKMGFNGSTTEFYLVIRVDHKNNKIRFDSFKKRNIGSKTWKDFSSFINQITMQ